MCTFDMYNTNSVMFELCATISATEYENMEIFEMSRFTAKLVFGTWVNKLTCD